VPVGFEWEIEQFPEETVSCHALVEYVRQSPIDKMIICSGLSPKMGEMLPAAVVAANDHTKVLMDAAPDIFFGSCIVNPHAIDTSLDEMGRTMGELGFSAIGEIVPHAHNFALDCGPVRRIFERAVELDAGLNVHSSEIEHIQHIVKLAGEYPEARIMMAHLGGFRFWRTGVEAVKNLDNVWVDVSAWCLFCMGALEGAVRRLGSSRVIFGSDFPLVDLDMAVWKIRNASLSEEDQEKVFWRNSAEVFRLPGLSAG
jgi:predicted TIM-barrel fold metal-dependent hydrolase